MADFRIHVVGVAEGTIEPRRLVMLADCRLIVAAASMQPLLRQQLPDYPRGQIVAITPLASALQTIALQVERGNIAVLASGDPLFFGIGEVLGRRFGRDRVVVHPAVSSMQLLFARLGRPWHDARCLSLHGRKAGPQLAEILSHPKVCLLTDGDNTPAAIATAILDRIPPRRRGGFSLFVGEHLGGADERITAGSLEEIAARRFDQPNTVVLLQDRAGETIDPVFGLGEHEIEHSRGLITKSAVRAAAIHALRLPAHGVLWDVGAGSGSISLESGRLAPGLQVVAVERNEEQLAHIAANRERYRAWNIEIAPGAAPAALHHLVAPDRVFVGGSGGQLAEIVAVSAARLKAGGRIVISAVLDATRDSAPELLHSQGLAVEITTLAVERRSYPDLQPTRLNPITLISGDKNI